MIQPSTAALRARHRHTGVRAQRAAARLAARFTFGRAEAGRRQVDRIVRALVDRRRPVAPPARGAGPPHRALHALRDDLRRGDRRRFGGGRLGAHREWAHEVDLGQAAKPALCRPRRALRVAAMTRRVSRIGSHFVRMRLFQESRARCADVCDPSKSDLINVLSSLEAHWHVLEAEVVEIFCDIERCEQCLERYAQTPLAHSGDVRFACAGVPRALCPS